MTLDMLPSHQPLPWKIGQYFNLGEVKCHHCGKFPDDRMMRSPHFSELIRVLDMVRMSHGKPINVNSWYRCKNHPIEKAKPRGPGVHSTGLAVDLDLQGPDAYRALQTILVQAAIDTPIRKFENVIGFGPKQHGSSRYLHFDIAGVLHRFMLKRPNLWTYSGR